MGLFSGIKKALGFSDKKEQPKVTAQPQAAAQAKPLTAEQQVQAKAASEAQARGEALTAEQLALLQQQKLQKEQLQKLQQQQAAQLLKQPGLAGAGTNLALQQQQQQARNDSISRAFLLAGLNPNAARNLAIGGGANFGTSRAFNLSGQQFLTSANPNIILGNAFGGNLGQLGLGQQQPPAPLGLNTVM